MSSPCDRCLKEIDRGYPVDSPTVPNWVCEGCLKDTDEVLDL